MDGSDTTTADGPVPLSQVWIGDRIIARDVQGDDLVDVLQQNGDASAWAVVPRAETGELRRLAKILDLDELALAALLLPGHRIGFSELSGTNLVRLRVPVSAADLTSDGAAIDLSMIIADQVLIMLVDDQYGRDLARMLSGAGHRLTRGGPERAAQLAIELTVSRLSGIVAELEDAGDKLAEELFGGQPLSRSRKLDAFRLRRSVAALRRITEPTRDMIAELASSQEDLAPAGVRHWTMIIDHADRTANNVVALAESLTVVFDTSLSLDNARLEEVMKKLTGWAAIIAVPTLITGFVGMNVDFWLHQTVAGFYLYLAVILAAAVVLYLVFRRKGWL